MVDAWDLNSLEPGSCGFKSRRPHQLPMETPTASPEGLAVSGINRGAAEGTRTPDPIITNDVLYQLSYSGIWLCRAG